MTRPLVIGAVAFGLVTFAYRYLSFSEFSNDHFVHLSLAQQITRGALPVRDFVERGLPLMSLASAAGQAVLGTGLRSELIVIALAFGLASALTFAAAAQLSGAATIAVVAAAVPVLAYPVSYGYPKLLAPAVGLMAASWYCAMPNPRRGALLAAAIVVAFLFRHDLAVLLGAGVLAMMLGLHGLTRAALIAAARVTVVATLVVSPYLLWLQMYQGVGAYVRDGIAFSRREAQRSNWLWDAPRFSVDTSRPFLTRLGYRPVVNVRWQPDASEAAIGAAEARHGLIRLDLNSPQSWRYELSRWSANDLEQLVKDPAAADTQGIDRAMYHLQTPAPGWFRTLLIHIYGPGDGLRLAANSVAALYYAIWLLPFAAAVALAARWKGTLPAHRALVTMVVVVQLVMNATMLRDPLDTRMRDVLVPTALLMSYLAGLAWWAGARGTGRVARRVVTVCALVGIAASAAVLGDAWTGLGRTQIAQGPGGIRQQLRQIRRTLAPPDQRTGRLPAGYRPLVDYIARCTPGDARLLTLTFAPEIFFFTGRAFAGGQVSLSPGYFAGPSHAALLIRRVSSEYVPLVIMDNQTQQEMLGAYPEIGAYVRAHYAEVGRFPLTPEKAFVVLGANGATSAVTIGDQQLPCFAGPRA
jgi:hypothetical protein